MITRLKISGYKSLREVELSDLSRLVVLFGANAAGKSNFLDALDLLSHLAKEDTVIGAFQRHRGNRLDRPLPVRWFFNNPDDQSPTDEMSFDLDLELSPSQVEQLNRELEEREKSEKLERSYTRVTQTRLRYRIGMRYLHESRSLSITSESLVPLRVDGSDNETIIPYIKRESPNRVSVKLERQAHPRRYEFPRQRSLLSEIGDAVSHPHLVAVSRELRSLRVYYVEPSEMRAEVSDVEANDPGPHGEQLASFYYWLRSNHRLAFKNIVDNMRQMVPTIKDIDVREAVEGFLEIWVKESNNREFPATLVSEGTLRLLCLLGIAATPIPPSIVGYEEPENGVNPARLREMLSTLENSARGRTGSQFFITTHSPEVIDFFEDATAFEVHQDSQGTRFTRAAELPLFKQDDVKRSLGREPRRGASLGQRIKRGDLG